MRFITVQSTDKTAWIRIEQQHSEHFIDYLVSASLRGESVTNESVVFSGAPEFLRSLATFERTRAGSATLDGTEDCRLVIEADGQMGHAWLTFQVARTLYTFSPQTGRSRSGRITLSGSFPLSGELMGDLLQDFAELFREDASGTVSP